MTQELVIKEDMPINDLGEMLVKSGYFADAKQASQAVVKVLAGRELGLGPIASMTGINIIKGKVALGANLMASTIKMSGRYNYRVTEHTNQKCVIQFTEDGEPCGESTFTMEDAKVAGLGGDQYRKYPRNMLFARALSNGARWYCPDLSGGPLYTPEELDGSSDGTTEAAAVVVDADGVIPVEAEPTEQEQRTALYERLGVERERLGMSKADLKKEVEAEYGVASALGMTLDDVEQLVETLETRPDPAKDLDGELDNAAADDIDF